jgi:hypothetical protein
LANGKRRVLRSLKAKQKNSQKGEFHRKLVQKENQLIDNGSASKGSASKGKKRLFCRILI